MSDRLQENKTENKKEYLSQIHSVEDFKTIPEDALGEVSDEIRSRLIEVVTKNGGHLASNLGVVELTMAIHRVFNSPVDHIIFDVGHQSYVHKILTGRNERIDTIRQPEGLSGFMKPGESEHDCFGSGHSSTSLSAGLGFAIADRLEGNDAYTVVVFGDGAYTGGMIHEALNNCRKDLHLVIIINENEMSISKNIGRFAGNLSKLRATSGYFRTKRATGRFLKRIPLVGKWMFNSLRSLKIMLKNSIYGSNYFESMGLTYLGPIDGNDYFSVEKLLKEAKKLNESVIVHLKTQKGKGYKPAEDFPSEYHSMSPKKGDTGKRNETFSEIFGTYLTEKALQDKSICAITAAMSDGTGLSSFERALPERFFDVGIAEGHALTFAAGLAANNMHPVAAIYSTFLQRGYDSIIHDIALQKLPVIMAVDRAGLNAKDGATHHGIFDVAFLSHIPGIKIYTPITQKGLCASIDAALESTEPCAIRYPSGMPSQKICDRFYGDGKYSDISLKTDFDAERQPTVIIITHGSIISEAIEAAEAAKNEYGVDVGIVLLEMIKPYDRIAQKIEALLPNSVRHIIFLEQEIKSGGMGMNLSCTMHEYMKDRAVTYDIMATDESFVESVRKGESVYDAAGVGKKDILAKISDVVNFAKK